MEKKAFMSTIPNTPRKAASNPAMGRATSRMVRNSPVQAESRRRSRNPSSERGRENRQTMTALPAPCIPPSRRARAMLPTAAVTVRAMPEAAATE